MSFTRNLAQTVAGSSFRGRFALASLLVRLASDRSLELSFAGRLQMTVDLGEAKYWELATEEYGIEEAVWRHMVATIQPGDTVFDVGANWGLLTMLAAALTGPEGRVVALEPNPRCVAQLQQNTAQANAKWVEVRPFAVSARGGETVRLAVPQFPYLDTGALLVSGAKRRTQPVQTVALDDEWERLGRPHLRLLKIDVNGAELAALQGARGLLRSGACEAVIAEVSDWTAHFGQTSRATLEELAQSGYAHIYLMHPGPPYWRTLPEAEWDALPASSNICASRAPLPETVFTAMAQADPGVAFHVQRI